MNNDLLVTIGLLAFLIAAILLLVVVLDYRLTQRDVIEPHHGERDPAWGVDQFTRERQAVVRRLQQDARRVDAGRKRVQ